MEHAYGTTKILGKRVGRTCSPRRDTCERQIPSFGTPTCRTAAIYRGRPSRSSSGKCLYVVPCSVLSRYVNAWCTASTIEHWLKLHEDYYLYNKNIKPGLTAENKVKQVLFSQHVHNLWGLPKSTGRKILLMMCDDEKVSCLSAPYKCEGLQKTIGLHKSTYSAQHKSHIGKVTVHCTVGYLYVDDPELGGRGFLIGCNRCAGCKVPLRDIRISTRDPLIKN
jgi:hypothetical protein